MAGTTATPLGRDNASPSWTARAMKRGVSWQNYEWSLADRTGLTVRHIHSCSEPWFLPRSFAQLKSIRRTMWTLGHHYVLITMCWSLLGTTQCWNCIYIPVTEETLNEAEEVSFGTESGRRVVSWHRACWLWYIQNVSFVYIPMKDVALKMQISQHLWICQHVVSC